MLDRKKVGEKRKKRAFIAYILIIIYFFTSKSVTRTTKQVLKMLVAYLNNRVVLHLNSL